MEQPKSSFKIVSDKKARMILPNAITLIGVCIGLTSIKFALDGKFSLVAHNFHNKHLHDFRI